MISRLMMTMLIGVIVTMCVVPYPTSIQAKHLLRRGTIAQTKSLATEVMQLRSEVQSAIKRRDAARLARLYADDFTHTHAVGRVDDKAQRIAALVSGEPTIESVTPDELKVRIYKPSAAVATGRSTLKDDDGEAVSYRWTTMYAKRGGRWQVVASHASRIVTK